jgi:DNA primase
MALYTADSIERVKDAVDMVELVGARSDLRRVGGRYTGLCPFHDERTPSFSVNAENKLYYCFGCGASGDAIRFVQETEALDFKGAVELLADRYGVELRREREDPRAEERRRRRERLLALVEKATVFYGRFLWESAQAARARAYLAGRGLGEEVLREFRVGYSPSAVDRIVLAAQRDGYDVREVAAAGLAQRGRQGGLYDRFRGRIMFPLADARGRVLGFGARALRDDQQPKYLNTSENELYQKGRQLFGIDRARAAAAKAGRVIVVEGYTDVLALRQAGIREVVAIMGTALTQEQLAELSRVAKTVYLALDADRSGQEAVSRAARSASDDEAPGRSAMLRAARSAAGRDVELLVVAMPDGTDPAELVAERGAAAFAELVEGALSVPEFEARRVLADADLASARGRDSALERVRPIVAATPANSATRDALVRFVADRLDVPPEYLMTQSALAGVAPGRNGASAGAPAPQAPRSVDAVLRAERAFLTMCVARRDVGPEYLARLEDDHLSSGALRGVRDWLIEHFDDPLAALPVDDPSLAASVTEVVMAADEEPSSEPVVRLGFLQLELRRIERSLRHAEQAGDFERQRELWGAREDVRGRLDEVMGETA